MIASAGALASFWRSRMLRPLGAARAAGSAAEWMWYTSATVFAYQLGGVSSVGVVAVASVLPAAVLSPLLSYVIDRFPRHRVLTGAVALRAAALSLATVSYYTAPSVALLALCTAFEGVATLLVRPVTTALLPFVTTRPAELVSAQATLGALDSTGLLVGSVAGGLVLTATTPGVTFATAAAIAAVAVLASVRVRIEVGEDRAVVGGGIVAVVRQSFQGFPAVVRNQAWVVSALAWSALFVSGATEVLVVAIAFDRLGLPEWGPGLLTACIGFGGILGAATMSGAGGRRLGPWMVGAMALLGVPLALTAAMSLTGVVLALMAVLGGGLAVAVVAAQSQLQRVVDEARLGRALGIAEAIGFVSLALGAATTPQLIERIGLDSTLLVIGAAAPAAGLLLARSLWRLDDAVGVDLTRIESLEGIAFLEPLPNVMRSRIATRVGTATFEAGEAVTVQGEYGDAFFIIDSGMLDVEVDGRRVRALGPGEFFGELALLHDEPRSATVRARGPTALRVLHGPDFLSIVTGHAGIGRVVSTVADERRQARPDQGEPN